MASRRVVVGGRRPTHSCVRMLTEVPGAAPLAWARGPEEGAREPCADESIGDGACSSRLKLKLIKFGTELFKSVMDN